MSTPTAQRDRLLSSLIGVLDAFQPTWRDMHARGQLYSAVTKPAAAVIVEIEAEIATEKTTTTKTTTPTPKEAD